MKITKRGSRILLSCTDTEARLVEDALGDMKENRTAEYGSIGNWDSAIDGMLVDRMLLASAAFWGRISLERGKTGVSQ